MILGENTLPERAKAVNPGLDVWQTLELQRFGRRYKRLILADPRTGKTYYSARWLRGIAAAPLGMEQMVVSAPLRVCPTWEAVLGYAGLPTISAYDITSARARTALRRGWSGVVIVNHDKLWALRDILYARTQVFICDEVHHLNSPSSHRGKAGRRIAHEAQYVRALTATPTANHKGNLWCPLNMVDAWPKSWTAFCERYLVRDMMFPSIIKSIINEDELDALLAHYATIIPRESVLGPDEYQFIHREVTLPPAIMAMYRKLAKEWVVDEPFEVVADHTLTRHLRLQQITSGTLLPTDDIRDDYDARLLHTAKVDAVRADLDEIFEAGKKAVVFHRFVPEGLALAEALRSYDDVPVFCINGSVNATQSEEQRLAFQAHAGAAVCIINIGSGGEGISLDTAEYALYLSRDFSWWHDKQSRDRVFAPNTPRTVIYYEVPGTIDLSIARSLDKKRDLYESIRAMSAFDIVFGVAA